MTPEEFVNRFVSWQQRGEALKLLHEMVDAAYDQGNEVATERWY